MPTLHLGVQDIAYSDTDAKGATTTGEVAEFLEKRYHVMETFYELYQEKIGQMLADSMSERIESLMQGNPNADSDLLAVGEVEKMFRKYLDLDEWQSITGQTILAAKLGISHRKKKKKRIGPREAFVDSGTYQTSFKAWVSGL